MKAKHKIKEVSIPYANVLATGGRSSSRSPRSFSLVLCLSTFFEYSLASLPRPAAPAPSLSSWSSSILPSSSSPSSWDNTSSRPSSSFSIIPFVPFCRASLSSSSISARWTSSSSLPSPQLSSSAGLPAAALSLLLLNSRSQNQQKPKRLTATRIAHSQAGRPSCP